MRILAFDYGTKRIGIATTDPLQIIATALTTLHPDKIWPYLETYLQQEDVETFVVGMPLQMDGTASVTAQHVTGFVRKLKRLYPSIPVELMDERFTSKMALASLREGGVKLKNKDKGIVDSVSATIILQSYLEKKSFHN